MGQVMAGAAGLTAGHMVGKVLGGGGGGGAHNPYPGYSYLTIFLLQRFRGGDNRVIQFQDI